MLDVVLSNRFKKDLKLAAKRGLDLHALNAIAYYLRANDMDTPDVLEELDRAAGKLAAMQPGVEALCRSVEDVSGSVIAALGR